MSDERFGRLDRPEVRDALDALDAEGQRQLYAALAVERGRPTEPCECGACDCELHTYPGEMGCIWCSRGVHSESDERDDGGVVDALRSVLSGGDGR